jgi:hypothetical protein
MRSGNDSPLCAAGHNDESLPWLYFIDVSVPPQPLAESELALPL